eukprot:3948034-Lingulodinium_polyedra.AAC.1
MRGGAVKRAFRCLSVATCDNSRARHARRCVARARGARVRASFRRADLPKRAFDRFAQHALRSARAME